MPSRKTATVVAISGTILVGGVAYVLWKRRQNNGEHDDATDSAAFTKKMTTTVNDSALSNNKAFANAISTRQTEIDVSMATKSDSVHVYEALGLIMKLVPNWKIADDVAPLPNMAMITIQNSNYSYDNESMCGKAPLLILSIEDVSLEKLDAQEFKAKSKAIALRQMHAMTNGMIPPNITFDGKEVNGPFQMKFQYSILSPMLQLQVVNYITVVNELAYVLQFMASPDVFQACESDVLKIAHQVEITNIPTHPTSFTEIAVRNGIQLRMPASWIISGVADAETSPFVIETPSPTKPDRVEILYKKANYTEQDIKEICEKDAGSKLKLTSEHGYKSGTYVKFNKTIMVCSKGNFFVRVTPMQASSSTITKAELQNLVDSMEYGASKKDYMTYKNRRYEFSIDVQPNSRLVESRIGDTAITFAPEGIIMDPTSTEPKPLLTIRIGDPSTEADCETSLEGWMTRMKHEFAMAGGQVTDLRYDSINEHKCLTFSEVQSQETMMGQEENKAKIIVFVQDGRTYMLRWEVPKTAWNQFEATMYKLLETFKFTC